MVTHYFIPKTQITNNLRFLSRLNRVWKAIRISILRENHLKKGSILNQMKRRNTISIMNNQSNMMDNRIKRMKISDKLLSIQIAVKILSLAATSKRSRF